MLTPASSTPAAPAGRADTPANRAAAAIKFEAMMMGEMLSAMRKAKLSDGLFDGGREDDWRQMSDQMLAETMAATSPLGLAAKLKERP